MNEIILPWNDLLESKIESVFYLSFDPMIKAIEITLIEDLLSDQEKPDEEEDRPSHCSKHRHFPSER